VAMQFKHRVLVVDDDSGIRNVTAVVLQVNNYSVSSAENGVAAIPILKSTRPHVMISDLRMPEMDGYELLRLARRFFPAMGTIVVSALDGTEMPGRDLADAIFVKGDYRVPDLLEAVADLSAQYPLRIGNGRSPVSPSWIAQEHRSALWIICKECLACFALSLAEMGQAGMHNRWCPSCSQKVRFMVQPGALEAVAAAA
jgi:CheY-like chemotaxis protein